MAVHPDFVHIVSIYYGTFCLSFSTRFIFIRTILEEQRSPVLPPYFSSLSAALRGARPNAGKMFSHFFPRGD